MSVLLYYTGARCCSLARTKLDIACNYYIGAWPCMGAWNGGPGMGGLVWGAWNWGPGMGGLEWGAWNGGPGMGGLEWGAWYGGPGMGGLVWGPGIVRNVPNPVVQWSERDFVTSEKQSRDH